MARTCKIRDHGAIPERRHDAFLLALLLAIVLNIAFFAIQAIIPRLSSLLQYLGPDPVQQEETEEALPFVLVDPALFDEEVDDSPPDAESLVARQARQTESVPALPEDKPYVPEGAENLSTMLEGAPGPAEAATVDAAESAPSEANDQEPSEPPEGQPAESTEAPEEPAEQQPSPVEPVPETTPPEPEQQPEPEPIPEPPPPEPEPIPEPPPPPEHVPEPEPDPLPDPPEDTQPEPELQPEPAETIDLASLPVTPDGFLDPQRQYLEELARREEQRQREAYLEQQRREEYERQQLEMMRQQELERQRREEYERQLQEQLQEQLRQQQIQEQMQQQQTQQPAQPPPETPRPRAREGRPQPTFRRIGPGSEASAPSRRGGAPRQRNTMSSVNLLDSDPNMKYLAHKYAAYMKKLAELLQQSLNREVVLQPMGYTTGQAKIRFTIAPDGELGYHTTEYPDELNYVRITSENTLLNAAPFDPPTREMLEDPIFRQMSLTVNLY